MDGSRQDRLALEGASFPAIEAVEAMIAREEPGSVDFLVALSNAAPSEDLLGVMAADFVYALLYEHATAFLDLLERAARQHAAFRSALRSAFLGWDDLPDQVRERLAEYI